MRLVDILRHRKKATGGGGTPGVTLLSTLLPTLTVGAPLTLGPTDVILVDLQMTYAQRIGAIGGSGKIKFSRTVNSRLYCDGLDLSGSTAAVDIGSAAEPRTEGITAELVLCGAMPTVNSYTPSERTALGIGTALIRGLTHKNADGSFNYPSNTPTGNDGVKNDNMGRSRGLLVSNGAKLLATGPVQTNHRTKLAANWTAGTSITVQDPVTVYAGEKVWVSPSSYYDGVHRTEQLTVAADCINNTTITLSAGPTYPRHGKIMYATDAGLSYTQDQWTTDSLSATVSISGATMTVSGTPTGTGTIKVGHQVRVPGTVLDYYIIALGTGTGGAGTYTLSRSITVASVTVNVYGMKVNAAMTPQLDDRAWVIIPRRNITIRAATDAETGTSAIATFGFGFQIMAMDLATQVVMDGVYLRDYGMLGLLGRYGMHWHVPSYAPNGTILGNYSAGMAIVTRCVFDTGHNRAVTLHAVRGAVSTYNVSFRSKGHSFFEEDGSEVQNTNSYNLAFMAVDPGVANRLKDHDQFPSGHWWANFENDHTGNEGIDCDGYGWLNSMSAGIGAVDPSNPNFGGQQNGCLGYSGSVQLAPAFCKMGTWFGNKAKSNNVGGGGTNNVAPVDNAGHYSNYYCKTTVDGLIAGTIVDTLIEAAEYYNNTGGAYFNRIFRPHYRGWKVVRNGGNGLQGSTQNNATADQFIVAGYSLNTLDGVAANAQAVAFATYHGTLAFVDIASYNYPAGEPAQLGGHVNLLGGPGTLEAWDLYQHGVDCFMSKMTNWRFANAVPQFKTPPAHILSPAYDSHNSDPLNRSRDYNPSNIGGSPHYVRVGTLEGACQDPNGILTGVLNSWSVFNHPFLTYGQTSAAQGTGLGFELQAVVTGATSYFGMTPDEFGEYPASNILGPLTFRRLDSSYAAVSGADWVLGDANGNPGLFTNHHAAIARGARVRIFNHITNTPFSGARVYSIYNCVRTIAADGVEDWAILAFDWLNSNGVTGVRRSGPANDDYTAVGSRAALEASTSAGAYWQDTTNNKLYIRITGTPAYRQYYDDEATCPLSKLYIYAP